MTEAMTCPRCGAPMNHQANKLVEPTSREEAESVRALGGILVAVFACPSCGYVASRREDEPHDR
jgi:NMD protein affecting ribosome stability and mRNA decay